MDLASFRPRLLLSVILFFAFLSAPAQSLEQRLAKAYQLFEKDPQLRYASHSLTVMDLSTGKTVFARNSQTGLAPASTQKVVTAAAAFALLGSEFRYQTEFTWRTMGNRTALVIQPSGDPSLGSPRFRTTNSEELLRQLQGSSAQLGRSSLSDTVYFIHDRERVDPQMVPDGWIVQDIGNYYGAGAAWFNWRENQFDLLLRSGSRIGEAGGVELLEGQELPDDVVFDNRLRPAGKGSGDNAYIYLPLEGNTRLLKGTIPIDENRFSISGAITKTERYFLNDWQKSSGKNRSIPSLVSQTDAPVIGSYQHESPALDSLSYWFLRKSINLYGEAFLKTIGHQEAGRFSTEAGLQVLRGFWQQKGIDSFALRMEDGSGLSPQNRVTTAAMVQVLKYASTQNWFAAYRDGFPLYNGMRMKSGTISAVKGFCGYHRSSKTGREYAFAILVNNYTGSSSQLVGKMYAVLNELK